MGKKWWETEKKSKNGAIPRFLYSWIVVFSFYIYSRPKKWPKKRDLPLSQKKQLQNKFYWSILDTWTVHHSILEGIALIQKKFLPVLRAAESSGLTSSAYFWQAKRGSTKKNQARGLCSVKIWAKNGGKQKRNQKMGVFQDFYIAG